MDAQDLRDLAQAMDDIDSAGANVGADLSGTLTVRFGGEVGDRHVAEVRVYGCIVASVVDFL